MKILLFGSIAAGKTELAKDILRNNSQFEYLAIDDFRRKYGDGSMDNEAIAQNSFIDSIKLNENQIIEASGLGKLGYRIFEKLAETKESVLLVIVYINRNEITKRLKSRNWDVPFPGGKSKLDRIITDINLGIKQCNIQMIWSEKENLTILKTSNNSIKDKRLVLSIINDFVKL